MSASRNSTLLRYEVHTSVDFRNQIGEVVDITLNNTLDPLQLTVELRRVPR